MSRFAAPGWRVAGAIVSWAAFAFCFALLYQSAAVVMGLGGFCASGGPYEIAVECPDAVAAAAPLSIFGGFIAVGLSLLFARGFGMPLVAWAWPILFLGLGIAFLIAGVPVLAWGFLVPGVLFIAMGGVPLWILLCWSPAVAFLGTIDAAGRPFAHQFGPNRPRGVAVSGMRGADPEAAREATVADGVLALAVAVIPAALGVYFAVWLFSGQPPFAA
ncbi:MAG: hypothetical protein J0G30_03640 [Actinomycetales bacterium]|nr:hypothetical protein [Actinomycetales bacterium]